MKKPPKHVWVICDAGLRFVEWDAARLREWEGIGLKVNRYTLDEPKTKRKVKR